MKRYGILVNELAASIAPGPIFSSQGDFRHCLRLNFGDPWHARMIAGMTALGKLLARAK